MKNRTFQEDFSSQLPALRLLQALGYTYLSQDKVMELRQHRTSNVSNVKSNSLPLLFELYFKFDNKL